MIYAPDAAFTCGGSPYSQPGGLTGFESQGVWKNVPIVEGDGKTYTDVKFYGSAIVSTKAKNGSVFNGTDSNAASNTNIAYNKTVSNNVASFLMSLAGGGTGSGGGSGSGGSWTNPKWSDN